MQTGGISRRRRWRPAGVVRSALAFIVAAAVLVLPAQAADPNALWHVVHDLCVPAMKSVHRPAPCTKVDLRGGYAVLKDIRGDTELLLIPTRRVGGIEDPQVLAAASPNYWQDAWDAKGLFEARARRPVPRDDLGLAINSVYGRSQNQLHIHIDCVRRDVRDALAANLSKIGPRWSTLPVTLAGHRYRAMRLVGESIAPRNPFALLARGDPEARADMGRETLAVFGATFARGQPGFILLSDRADALGLDIGASEQLLDHGCAVLGPKDRHGDQAAASPAAER
ncbi:MAG: CDP-diacylglycerol diphosphatase, partial [Gemmatimonadales bacterium]